MLGVYADADYAHATFQVHTGDLLLMYTDGFVEDRHGGFDEGVLALCEQARMALEVPLPDRPGALVGRLRQRNPQDDACVLAAEPL
jgi:serine phosphatase RsbU (regulator of sigma subunit)